MATTYISRSCPKCGYTVRKSIYGFLNDPLGSPFAQCPLCKSISKVSDHREWVQMSPFGKFISIVPRAFVFAIFYACVFIALIFRKFDAFWEASSLSDSAFGWILFGLSLIIFLISYYLIVITSVNRERYFSRIYESICRSRNPVYMELLKKQGKIYGEALPFGVWFTRTSSESISAIKVPDNPLQKLSIPSLDSSIING